jgi:hypothetical protein
MAGAWIVHVKTCLLNDIRDVQTRDGKVLKCASKVLILGRIVQGLTGGSVQLVVGANWSER